MFAFFRHRRRRKLLAEPFPPHWDAILRRNVGHYPHLSDAERARLRDVTRVFVAEKTWEGCNGLAVTEEMKVTVAAQAGLLLLGTAEHDFYNRVPSVVLYPTQFHTPVETDNWEDDGLSDDVKDGLAAYRGPVLLAWDIVVEEGRDPGCGHNVVIHEFAHQLDYLDDLINGTPPMPADAAARWRDAMTAGFDRHCKDLEAGAEETFFSEQAAENETEFFADAAEAFFCAPAPLRDEEPAVYAVLSEFFRLDPAGWFPDVR